MRQLRIVVYIVFVALVSATPLNACAQQSGVRVLGTFSNLEYNEEGGDLLGIEVKIVPVGDHFQGAVFVSEGEPQPMILVDVRVHGASVAFDVPGKDKSGWTFSGLMGPKGLSGTIQHDSGGVEKVLLSRRCGYWDH